MHEHEIRLAFFIGIFSTMVIWEILARKRPLTTSKSKRWLNNIGLVVLDSVLVRFLLPAGAVAIALWAEQHQLGLLYSIHMPNALQIVIAVLTLDLVIYWQHRLFHRIPWLWKLHQVHHADRDIDVSTALRFHPIEILISMLIKLVAVLAIGAPALAVVIFEIVLNGMAMFNHANIKLPQSIDSLLRIFVVTPDMHRVHHSVVLEETNSNYGFNISLWDKIFASYHAQPAAGHDKMVIGLTPYLNQPTHALGWMLRLPFRDKASAYASRSDT